MHVFNLGDLQYSKTETTCNGDLFLPLHVEIPDNEPWQNGEGEVRGDEPCCKTVKITSHSDGRSRKLTSNSIPNMGKIDPAIAWYLRVPDTLGGNALHEGHNTGEQREDSRDCKTRPDNHDLNLTSHNPKQEPSDSEFAQANCHQARKLANQFPLHALHVDIGIANIFRQLSDTVVGPYTDERGVKDMENL